MTLHEFRMKHDLTLEQFAVKIGVCSQTLQRWELGKNRPGLLARRRLRQLGFREVGESREHNTPGAPNA